MGKIRVIELFAGIGAFSKALKKIGIEEEIVGFSEIDKYAIKSYCAIHNVDESKNLGDITKIKYEKLPKDIDLICGGFPCQAFSIAGKRLGIEDTRGTLFYNMAKVIEYCEPKYFIFENVKGLLNHDKGRTIETILEVFGQLKYEITLDLLNAKDYNICQNRERIYCIGKKKSK